MSQTERVQALLAQVQAGTLTMEQALLQAAAKPATTSNTIVDRIAAANDMTTITDLAVAYKKAAAKMSSAKARAGLAYENNASYLKYKKEFETIKARKNELYSGVSSEKDAVKAAIAVGASVNAIVQAFMGQYNESLMKEVLKIKAKKNLTTKQITDLINSQPNTPSAKLLKTLDTYQADLSSTYLARNDKDQFVVKLNKLSQVVANNK